MKLEVRQVLEDVSFFKEKVKEIRFMKKDGVWYTNFPSIASWTDGDIVLVMKNSSSIDEVKQHLTGYGIQAAATQQETAVRFSAKAGDDIIFVLHKAMHEQKLQEKANRLANQINGLNQNVDQLIKQLPHVQRGAFSRGVNAFKNQVDVLKNIREVHIKENQH